MIHLCLRPALLPVVLPLFLSILLAACATPIPPLPAPESGTPAAGSSSAASGGPDLQGTRVVNQLLPLTPAATPPRADPGTAAATGSPATPGPAAGAEPSPTPPATATTPPTPTPVNRTARLVWFYKPPGNADVETLVRNFDDFILTHGDEELREELRARGVRGPFYVYILLGAIQNPGSCTEAPWRNQVAFEPGDFCRLTAEHPDWFLYDRAGNRIAERNFYLMDPANPEWRAFWLERARRIQRENGWDGIFLDNVDASLARFQRLGHLPVAYPTDADWQAATEDFLRFLATTYFQPEDQPIYADITGLRDPAIWFRYLEYLDGAMDEAFVAVWVNRYASAAEWEEHVRRAEQTQALGKKLYFVSQGLQDDTRRQEFAFASYLLALNGRASFRYSNSRNYDEVWLYSNYALDLGEPLGPRYREVNVWRRDFTHGSVVVNPFTHQAEIVTR